MRNERAKKRPDNKKNTLWDVHKEPVFYLSKHLWFWTKVHHFQSHWAARAPGDGRQKENKRRKESECRSEC